VAREVVLCDKHGVGRYLDALAASPPRQHLITLVQMVVIDRQRRGAGKPKKLSTLDL
jgi:hypothetical protein